MTCEKERIVTVITLFHGHGQKDMSKSRINGSRQNLFDKSMKAMKVKDG